MCINPNCDLFVLDETGVNYHPSTPAGLYETMSLPDPVVQGGAGPSSHSEGGACGSDGVNKFKKDGVKADPERDARRLDRVKIKRRKGDVATEDRREQRATRKKIKVDEEGYDPVRYVN